MEIKDAGYICISIVIKISSFPIFGIAYLLAQFGLIDIIFTANYLTSLVGITYMLIPITFSLAIAQKINDFKKEALDKQILLNKNLENKIEEKIFWTKKVNIEINESCKNSKYYPECCPSKNWFG